MNVCRVLQPKIEDYQYCTIHVEQLLNNCLLELTSHTNLSVYKGNKICPGLDYSSISMRNLTCKLWSLSCIPSMIQFKFKAHVIVIGEKLSSVIEPRIVQLIADMNAWKLLFTMMLQEFAMHRTWNQCH